MAGFEHHGRPAFAEPLQHHIRSQYKFVAATEQQLVDLIGSQPVALEKLAGQAVRFGKTR
ncbi:hypothetical protein AYO44_06030 [Planctomycetaceae bacterium SCGC AG-212-F19]|nr:hypothetical protein AYO44_06030 [Planctomycetaceae bacterium SCGC AG-212-F19]